jgi:hypothetical protein
LKTEDAEREPIIHYIVAHMVPKAAGVRKVTSALLSEKSQIKENRLLDNQMDDE